jgi:hypothetical protein
MIRRLRSGLTGVALVAAAVAVLAPASPVAAAPAPAVCAERDPLPGSLAGELAARYPGRRFSAAVIDSTSGCTYHLNPHLRMTTASVVKTEVLAGVLLRAQREGRPLTRWEQDRIWPMITQSANPPTTDLWSSLGGVAGMEAIDGAFGLRDTVHAGPTWGLTTTSALDQARLVRQVVYDGGPLTAASRAEARRSMTSVVPSQRWGASAGVPSGWTVAQKNGFAPSQCCRWRLNTAGWVDRPDGSGWAIVILSDGWASEAEGIAAVDALGNRINRVLADPMWLGPGASSAPAGATDLLRRQRSTGRLLVTRRTGTGPVAWTDAGGGITSDPDALVRDPSAPVEALARGLDGAVWHHRGTPGAAGSWRSLGGECTSAPAGAYTGPDRLDVACRGLDGQPWTRSWQATTGWGGWRPAGGAVTSAPDVIAGPAGGLQFVARGLDRAVWRYWWNGSSWSVHSLGGGCSSGPSMASTGPDRLAVFCRGEDGQLWWRSWTPAGWGSWQRVGGLLLGDVEAAARAGEAVPDVYATGLDLGVWRYRWLGDRWQVARVALA